MTANKILTSLFIIVLTVLSNAFTSTTILSKTKLGIRNSVYQMCKGVTKTEAEIIKLLNSIGGRGAQASPDEVRVINDGIAKLEGSSYKLSKPTSSLAIDGCWKLLYTSSPGTNSPIQRTFTSFDGVSVYQVVNIVNNSKSFLPGLPDISNVVCFGDRARLRVTALASTSFRPTVEPRKGDGKIFGLNIFGISSSNPPRDPSERVDFAFQEALFEFKALPVTIPYPVPFKLLGDEAKGWVDVTYLSPMLRIVRGNKGTTFVLQKSDTLSDATAAWAALDLKQSTESSPSTPASYSVSEQSNSPNNRLSWPWPSLVSAFASPRTPPKQKPVDRRPAVTIILPCQLGEQGDYGPLVQALGARGVNTVVTPLQRLDWPVGLIPSFFSADYFRGTLKPGSTLGFYCKKIDEAVADLLKECPEAEINLLGHSIGGWVARAWLSEWASPDVRAKVRRLVTLGSPHNPPPPTSALARVDQTRGLLSYINEKFPGAFEKQVSYTSVIGSGIRGGFGGGAPSAVALLSYAALSGDGGGSGDGIIPVASATVDGWKLIDIAEAGHADFLPLIPGRRVSLPIQWYGSEGIIDKWVDVLSS